MKAIIFGLWETLGTKHFSASKELRKKFNINNTANFLQKYESALHLNKWSDTNQMATNFLESFNLSKTKENINFITKIILKGVETATLFNGMQDLLKSLEENYLLALLSNTTNFEAKVIEKWRLQELFKVQVYPWKIGSLKPSKRNFDEVCSRLFVEPTDCIFIDNESRSITAAREFGFTTITFKDVNFLKKDLKKLHIRID